MEIPTTATISPSGPSTGLSDTASRSLDPSLCSTGKSPDHGPPLLTSVMMASAAAFSSGPTSTFEMSRPMTSPSLQPKSRSAALFHIKIVRSGLVTMTALLRASRTARAGTVMSWPVPSPLTTYTPPGRSTTPHCVPIVTPPGMQ